jgi:hypothetical protein
VQSIDTQRTTRRYIPEDDNLRGLSSPETVVGLLAPLPSRLVDHSKIVHLTIGTYLQMIELHHICDASPKGEEKLVNTG